MGLPWRWGEKLKNVRRPPDSAGWGFMASLEPSGLHAYTSAYSEIPDAWRARAEREGFAFSSERFAVEDNIRKELAQFVVRVMQAAQIPISAWPFWYRNLQENRRNYRPYLQQWAEDAAFSEIWRQEDRDCLVFEETAYLLFGLARLASRHSGEIWECGVYRGATARLLAGARDQFRASGPRQTIRLFDTFSGMPEKDSELDSFKIGSLADTSLESVEAKMKPFEKVVFHPGVIPNTFSGLEDCVISIAHVDVDQYETTKQCCRFIFPRMQEGAVMVIDDYGRPGTVGARKGADEYFEPLGIRPLALHSGQAIIIK